MSTVATDDRHDVFISYSKDHPEVTKLLAEALRDEGFSVWWDASLMAGQDFTNEITRRLKEARAIVVVWTPTSINSHWVRAEAEYGRKAGILVPVRSSDLDPSLIPLPFGTMHTSDAHDKNSILSALSALGLSSDASETGDGKWQQLRSGADDLKVKALEPLISDGIRSNTDVIIQAMYPAINTLAKKQTASVFKDVAEKVERARMKPFGLGGESNATIQTLTSHFQSMYLVDRKTGQLVTLWSADRNREVTPALPSMIAGILDFGSGENSGDFQSISLGNGTVELIASDDCIVAVIHEKPGTDFSQKLTRTILTDALFELSHKSKAVRRGGDVGHSSLADYALFAQEVFSNSADRYRREIQKFEKRLLRKARRRYMLFVMISGLTVVVALLIISLIGAALWEYLFSKNS